MSDAYRITQQTQFAALRAAVAGDALASRIGSIILRAFGRYTVQQAIGPTGVLQIAQAVRTQVGGPEWQDIETAPKNLVNVALEAIIECDCGKGGRILVMGNRVNGEWIVMCEHEIRLLRWYQVPLPDGWLL